MLGPVSGIHPETIVTSASAKPYATRVKPDLMTLQNHGVHFSELSYRKKLDDFLKKAQATSAASTDFHFMAPPFSVAGLQFGSSQRRHIILLNPLYDSPTPQGPRHNPHLEKSIIPGGHTGTAHNTARVQFSNQTLAPSLQEMMPPMKFQEKNLAGVSNPFTRKDWITSDRFKKAARQLKPTAVNLIEFAGKLLPPSVYPRLENAFYSNGIAATGQPYWVQFNRDRSVTLLMDRANKPVQTPIQVGYQNVPRSILSFSAQAGAKVASLMFGFKVQNDRLHVFNQSFPLTFSAWENQDRQRMDVRQVMALPNNTWIQPDNFTAANMQRVELDGSKKLHRLLALKFSALESEGLLREESPAIPQPPNLSFGPSMAQTPPFQPFKPPEDHINPFSKNI